MSGYSSPAERAAVGRKLRDRVPRSSHEAWAPPAGRDATTLVLDQDAGRLPWLVPERHRRMRASPFAFYRGASAVMAADLATTPLTGIEVQICGDAHLANFGLFASPERRLVFDLNDFDETLRGPWEWDVKRLATSFVIAAQGRGLDRAGARAAARAAVASYRRSTRDFASRGFLDAWYGEPTPAEQKRVERTLRQPAARQLVDETAARARRRDHLDSFDKLVEVIDGAPRIRNDAPRLVPLRDLAPDQRASELKATALDAFDAYKATLLPERRVALERFRPVDIAIKVVGVSSVGTRCLVIFLEGRDHGDPLFLQFKEARRSVLEPALGVAGPDHQGRRVVEGQRLMQTTSDIFLGWSRDVSGRDYYGRQLHDWKASFDVTTAEPGAIEGYAVLCGWTLARAHARSGNAIEIGGYLGSAATFDDAVADFAETYAAQTDRDHAEFAAAVE